MLAFLGDIHGEAWVLENYLLKCREHPEVKAIIQVGDFGLFEYNDDWFHRIMKTATIPVYFIDGNHDDCDRWIRLTEVTKIYDDAELYYLPRGSVTTIDGRVIATMGGAASIDKMWRLAENMQFTEAENIFPEDVVRLKENLKKNSKVDFFITHAPPLSVTERNFSHFQKLRFGVPIDWTDPNMILVEEMWNDMRNPPIISGHMHKTVVGENYRILDINEVFIT